MKRYGNLINKIADTDNIRLAFWKASKGKRAKSEIILFRKELEMNISSLREQILRGEPDVGHYTFFRVYDPKQKLNTLLTEIANFLNKELELKLKENIQLNYCRLGIPFLGYRVFPGTIRLLRQSKQRFIKKLRQFEYKFKYGIWNELTLQKHIQPLLEFVEFADTLRLRKKCLLQ